MNRDIIGAILDGTAVVALLAGILAGALGLLMLLVLFWWRR